ncbi:Endonuclease, Uma2 family (restriction endonuclease fold) [Granulicella rosea]|uniref:Endonuclease, Uma2 family (Restriction endonuclease fold) n=1 Tax=Granulicella rosea TaxID=474952 RepID=A0A239CRR9_9BACT|nr:Uma2 family endonuclease [Granulicella rosea]SNS22956.1 Endonuclease, Uma2 family (restriction endonuclease fold) [Granulicella rosea]
MATTNLPTLSQLISVEEYLKTHYRPDVDFVDGEIEERNVGEFDHADVQMAIGVFLRAQQQQWNIRVVPQVRVQISATRYRVPDICVIPGDWKREPIVRVPPLLCVEVLSPRDRLKRVHKRIQDFFDMGVLAVWILDPVTRTAYVCDREGMAPHREGTLLVEGTSISVPLEAIFSTLDE